MLYNLVFVSISASVVDAAVVAVHLDVGVILTGNYQYNLESHSRFHLLLLLTFDRANQFVL